MSGTEILAVGSEAQAEYDAANPAPTETETTATTEEAVQTDVDTQLSNQETTTDEVESAENKGDVETAEADEHKHFWGDLPVDIEVPQDVAAALAEHKIDATKLVDELFAKDGKFELSADSRKALDKAFGKTIVDGYLNLYKQQNQISVDQYKQQEESTRKQIETNTTDFETLVGGTEGWGELSEWVGSNMNEQEIAYINSVMDLPPEHYQAQRTVIEALQIKRAAGKKEADGDDSVTLLSDSGSNVASSTASVPNTLTREEFQAIMFTDKYRDDPKYAAAVDAVRRRTQQAERPARR